MAYSKAGNTTKIAQMPKLSASQAFHSVHYRYQYAGLGLGFKAAFPTV
jgi:hypothetical protein